MNNEFKKITEGSITRYVLEFAGGGGGGGATTGAGSVGTGIAQPMGGVHRRKGDNLISQENKKSYKVSHKPKNPVAKAHQTVGSGSGQHKDKTKVLPRQEKHKKPASALAESTTDHEAQMARSELYRNAKYAMGMLKMINPGDELEGWVESSLTKAAGALDKVYHYLDYETKFEKGIDHSDKQPEDEVVEDAEEASIARENLMLIAEYSMKLFKMIKDGDDLEGWVFMKLTKASEMISSAKHHLEYHHFQQHGLEGEEDPEDVKEGTDPRAERNMYIRAIHKATGWDISHLELASDDELKDLYQQHCHTDEDHNINPGWGAGAYDTYAGGRHGRGVAEGIDPFVAGKLNKLKDLNPVDRASAYGGIRSWLKDNPELAGQASKLASAYAMADVARQQYKTAQAKQMLADLEPQHQAFIKQALGQEQGVAEATPRHFGPKGAGTELARQIRANGELDRNKQPKPTGIPKKNEFNITEPKAKIQVKKDKGVAEADSYMESLAATLAEKLKPNDPPEKYIHYFLKGAQTPNAKGHHQFRNKSKAKVIQMANAASYAAKEKK